MRPNLENFLFLRIHKINIRFSISFAQELPSEQIVEDTNIIEWAFLFNLPRS